MTPPMDEDGWVVQFIRRVEPLAATKPLLVGESNPYGSDPEYALYPLPERASGWRLCKLVMGLDRGAYLRAFDRVNLCAGKWSLKEARSSAANICRHHLLRDDPGQVVLLGKKVCDAFLLGYFPFTRPSQHMVVLPHPSGLCRAWNEPGAFDRARAVLTEAGVLPVVGSPKDDLSSTEADFVRGNDDPID